jgi:hypothetical protein
MMNNTAFFHWVANTVAQCGGSYSQCLRDLQRKQALTFIETRMPACQGGFDVYFDDNNQASMRESLIVPANFNVLH